MFWKDDRTLKSSYKGWNVFVSEDENTKTTEFASYLKSLLEYLQAFKSVDTVTLLLPVKNQQNLEVYATIGLEEEIAQKIRIPIGQGIAGCIAASLKPMIVNNLSEAEVFSPILRQKNLRSLVGVPLRIKQDTVGVLHLGTFRSHQFTEHDVEELESFAHHLESIIADGKIFNFEWDCHNQEFYLENKDVRNSKSRFNTLYQNFMLNFSTLELRVT